MRHEPLCHGGEMTHPTLSSNSAGSRTGGFGEAHNLSVREVPTPSPRPDEMLVRVKATSVNPIECKMRRGLKLPVPKPIWRLLLGQEGSLVGHRRMPRTIPPARARRTLVRP